jgi:hypothetical protein
MEKYIISNFKNEFIFFKKKLFVLSMWKLTIFNCVRIAGIVEVLSYDSMRIAEIMEVLSYNSMRIAEIFVTGCVLTHFPCFPSRDDYNLKVFSCLLHQSIITKLPSLCFFGTERGLRYVRDFS